MKPENLALNGIAFGMMLVFFASPYFGLRELGVAETPAIVGAIVFWLGLVLAIVGVVRWWMVEGPRRHAAREAAALAEGPRRHTARDAAALDLAIGKCISKGTTRDGRHVQVFAYVDVSSYCWNEFTVLVNGYKVEVTGKPERVGQTGTTIIPTSAGKIVLSPQYQDGTGPDLIGGIAYTRAGVAAEARTPTTYPS